MDSNEEKKPRRPRIGENRLAVSSSDDLSKYASQGEQGTDQRPMRREYQNSFDRPYQPRPYGHAQGYNRQGGYNNHGGYNQGYQGGNRYGNQGGTPYQPRQRYTMPDSTGAEGTSAEGQGEQHPYQPRYNNNRPGGYGNNRPGGYGNNRPGGYGNNRPGGYGNNRPGGYGNNRPGGYGNNRPGGYGNNHNPSQPQADGQPADGSERPYTPRPQQGGQRPYGQRPQQGGQRPYGQRPQQQGGQRPYGQRPQQGGQRPYGQRQQQAKGGYNNQAPRPGKSFVPRPKRIEYEVPVPDPNEQVRLNKYMANAGICSRREADEFISQGLVKVNGQVVTELGTKISHSDVVEYDEKVVTLESKCYILLNKPKDCVTTSDDPNGRTTVLDLVKGACNERIYPVGRLDRNTTGVLLLTNDGDLASKLTHPKYVKKKIYHVWTDKDISEDDMQTIADGIELEDGPIHADAISYATETDRNQAGIEIHSGRNRIVRRIFEHLGYHVTKLDRVYFAGLTKKNLPRGRWRYLTQEEVNFLKMGSFE